MAWKDVAINEFSDHYEVSDTGNIRNKETGKVLKPHLNSKTGYNKKSAHNGAITYTIPL